MGRVKSAMIKKAARQLYEQVEGFNSDFEHNKKLLRGTMPFKLVRNKVAGAIVVLDKRKHARSMEHKESA